MSSITSSASTLVDPEISDGAQLTFRLAVVAVYCDRRAAFKPEYAREATSARYTATNSRFNPGGVAMATPSADHVPSALPMKLFSELFDKGRTVSLKAQSKPEDLQWR
jgi:hypothetical protein